MIRVSTKPQELRSRCLTSIDIREIKGRHELYPTHVGTFQRRAKGGNERTKQDL